MDHAGVAEGKSMAGQPRRHGPRWRVRWVHPDTKERAEHYLDTEPLGRRFSDWVTGLGNRVRQDDSRLLDDSWDPSVRASGVLGQSITWAAFVDKHLRLCEERELAANTIENKRYKLAQAVPDWGPLPLATITREMVLAAIKDMKKRGIAPSSIHIGMGVVKEVIKAAHDAGAILVNPFKANALASLPEIDTKKLSGFEGSARLKPKHVLRIQHGDWLKLLDAALELPRRLGNYRGRDERQLYLQLRTLIECGPRVGEMLAFKVGQCYFSPDDNFVVLQHTRLRDGTDGPTKTRKDREMGVPDSLAAELQELCRGRAPSDALFPSPLRRERGWRYQNWIACRWTPLMTLAKAEFGFPAYLEIHPHALRMNTITWLRAAGVPLHQIQQQVGHSSEAVTASYDLGGPESRRAVRSVANTWAPPPSV
jgi:integrase